MERLVVRFRRRYGVVSRTLLESPNKRITIKRGKREVVYSKPSERIKKSQHRDPDLVTDSVPLLVLY